MTRPRLLLPVIALALCAASCGGGGGEDIKWPNKVAAEEFVKQEVGASHVVCEPNGDSFTCKDTDFNVCYEVTHTGPPDAGTIHGTKIGPC